MKNPSIEGRPYRLVCTKSFFWGPPRLLLYPCIRFLFNQFSSSDLVNLVTYIVGSRGAVQLGGPDPWYNWGGPTKVGSQKSFLFTESTLE